MPFKSQAQRRFFYAANRRGEISDDDLSKWEKETPKGKKLPERKMVKRADDDEGKGRALTASDKAKIQAFIRKSPKLTDDEFHDFCEKLGVNVHKAEEVAYAMARSLAGGEAGDRKVPGESSKQLTLGKRVEMEHTRDPKVAEEIARDHLAEIPDYYTRLHKMESEAKMKKSAAFMAGFKTAAEDLYYGLNLKEDTRVRMMKELGNMEPTERERYLADMSAKNHRLAMESG